MVEKMIVKTNPDGTATATVGNLTKTFPDIYLAVEWAEITMYKLDGEESG